ncbi:UDP-N-acetylglucosamine 4,6-dehydratase family protein [Phosphitispora sp. TUW77]|uniref:UDP-N-acetylglucosamine 4,6-dehydratase family protein n=1 Tax=Phosphitispora sp. TUW77 TaxID=3152361 RepID=UPI003AB65426
MIQGRKILITGGTGTLGRALISEILKYEPKVVRVFSRDEAKQFDLQFDLNKHKNTRYLLGDIRDRDRVMRAMEDIDIVFHAAALKHVPSCEYNPFEGVKTNIIGTQNVIEAALTNRVSKVIYTSSDKAISPTNTMGATKLVAERLISAADYYKGTSNTVFAAVRFGNVMGSRGSVIPLFKKQIQAGGPLTVTLPEMTRFMMSLSQAVMLTLEAARRAKGGEIFVLKMPVIRLGDLAEIMVEEFAPLCGFRPHEIPVETIGLRPGEKMYEELMTTEEARFAMEFPNMFAIPPSYELKHYTYKGAQQAEVKTYRSDEVAPLNKAQLRQLLYKEELLERRKQKAEAGIRKAVN